MTAEARPLRRVEVRHACGCRVIYQHDLGAFVLSRWLAQVERCRCRRCLAEENLDALMTRGRGSAVQLTLF